MHIDSLEIIKTTLIHWITLGISYLPNLLVSLLVLVVCYFLTRHLKRMGDKLAQKFFGQDNVLQRTVNIALVVLCWALAIILVLNIMNLTSFVTHILAGAGVIGIVMGFALKDVVSNAFAGVLIQTQKPFAPGNWIEVNGYIGRIEKLGLILTGIKTIQGEMEYLPNKMLLTNSFINYSTFGKVRVVVNMGVSYGDDLDHVEEVTLSTLKQLPMIIDPEDTDFYIVNVGGSTYNFKARFWISFSEYKDWYIANSAAIKALKKAFEKADIQVAYNVMTLDFGVKGGVNLFDNPVKVEEKSGS